MDQISILNSSSKISKAMEMKWTSRLLSLINIIISEALLDNLIKCSLSNLNNMISNSKLLIEQLRVIKIRVKKIIL